MTDPHAHRTVLEAPERALLLAVLLLAFALRLAWAIHIPARTLGGNMDATVYHYGAVRIMEGYGYGSRSGIPTIFFPPGYSAVLAGAYSIFGPTLLVAKLVNVVADTLTCLLVFGIGRRAFGGRVGLIGAFVYALYPAHIFAMSATMSDIVFTFAFTSTLYVFLRWNVPAADDARGWHWVVLGVLLGLTSLIRGIALPFLGALAIVWWRWPPTRSATVRRTLMVALGLALVVTPWTLRNYYTTGSVVLLSTDGAWALFNGHSPEAFGAQSGAIHKTRRELFAEEMALPYPERDVALEKAQMRYAIRYALSHPGHELWLIPRRIYHLYDHDDWAFKWSGTSYKSPETGRRVYRVVSAGWDPALRLLANCYFHVMLALAAAGLLLSLRPVHRPFWLIPMVVIYFNAVHGLLFFGIPRYHAAFAPMLALLAALALYTASRWLGETRAAARTS